MAHEIGVFDLNQLSFEINCNNNKEPSYIRLKDEMIVEIQMDNNMFEYLDKRNEIDLFRGFWVIINENK